MAALAICFGKRTPLRRRQVKRQEPSATIVDASQGHGDCRLGAIVRRFEPPLPSHAAHASQSASCSASSAGQIDHYFGVHMPPKRESAAPRSA